MSWLAQQKYGLKVFFVEMIALMVMGIFGVLISSLSDSDILIFVSCILALFAVNLVFYRFLIPEEIKKKKN